MHKNGIGRLLKKMSRKLAHIYNWHQKCNSLQSKRNRNSFGFSQADEWPLWLQFPINSYQSLAISLGFYQHKIVMVFQTLTRLCVSGERGCCLDLKG